MPPMRPLQAFALVALLAIAPSASAIRAVARATIVVPADVSFAAAGGSPSVSIEAVREGGYFVVTVAFNRSSKSVEASSAGGQGRNRKLGRRPLGRLGVSSSSGSCRRSCSADDLCGSRAALRADPMVDGRSREAHAPAERDAESLQRTCSARSRWSWPWLPAEGSLQRQIIASSSVNTACS
jgi:hypothetical protein